MTDNDFAAFRLSLERTSEAFGKPLGGNLAALYFGDLKAYPLPAVQSALDKARQSSRYFPRISFLRELCQSDSAVRVNTDVPSWVNHNEGVYFCEACDDTGYVRRLECAGDGRCQVGHCGREGYPANPHDYTRACDCRGANPVLRRQREMVAERTAHQEA